MADIAPNDKLTPHPPTDIFPPTDNTAFDELFAELGDVLLYILSAKVAPHVLPFVREVPLAPSFLEAVVEHLADSSRKEPAPFTSIIAALATHLPKNDAERRALERLIRDLVWEIEQFQFG